MQRTHHGNYVIKRKSEYWEIIAKDTQGFMSQAGGKTAYVFYEFSNDKSLLRLKADPVLVIRAGRKPGEEGLWKSLRLEMGNNFFRRKCWRSDQSSNRG